MKSVAGAFFAGVNLLYAAMFGGPIDGTAWDVKVRQQGFFHWSSRQETLVFHGGKAVVAGAVGNGYSPELYEAAVDVEGTAFSVRLASEGRDLVEWSGRVRQGHIDGTMTVHRRNGAVARYIFSGARKIGTG